MVENDKRTFSFSKKREVVPAAVVPLEVIAPKYLQPEKVAVVLMRNGGILLEEEGTKGEPIVRKKDFIFMQSHKIPVEIRRAGRTRTNKKGWRKYGGVGLGIISSLCFSLTLVLAKVLRDDHSFHPICVTVWRYLGIFLPALPIALYFHVFTPENILDSVYPFSKNYKHCCTYVMQGICGCTAILFRFYSLEFLSLADSTVISYSSPILVSFLAHFILGEKCGVVNILAAVLTAVGVGIIARPPLLTGSVTYDSKLWVGVVFAVASMLCASCLLILIRNIRQTHFSLLLLISGGWGVFQSCILALTCNVLKAPSNLEEALLISALALLTFFGQVTIVLALKYESAGAISVVRCSEVLFSFLWQLQFLGVYPDLFSGIGAIIIVFAVVIIATRTWDAGLGPDPAQRKGLLYLTK